MKDFEVLASRYNEEHDRIEILKDVTNDDGSVVTLFHMFRPDVLEWRSAEYDIDDFDTLIDLIIHEPHIEGTDVYKVTKEVAREIHLKKINESKMNMKVSKRLKSELKAELTSKGFDPQYIDAVDNSYHDVLRNHCHFDNEAIVVKKEYVAKERAAIQQTETSTQKSSVRNVQELKKHLFRTDSVRNDDQSTTNVNDNHVQMIMRGGKIVKE